MNDKANTIHNVWKIEEEILQVFHDICEKYNLKYTLAYGTLIGAIRHQGFIPWDDDIDIMMPRKDYNTLLKIWNDVAPKDYIIQDYNTDVDYTNNFAKIRKDNTTFLQSEDEKLKRYHKGIFIDIFPGDRVAPGKMGKTIQYIASAFNLLYSRGYKSGTSGVVGKIEHVLLSVDREKCIKRRRIAEKIMCRWNENEKLQIVFPCTIQCCKKYYPSDMFSNLVKIKFDDEKYYVTKDADKILRLEYGDYMKLPPKSERIWKHHPLLIDFEHNYEDLE